MTRIVLDASLSSKLNDLARPVEVCDPSGRVLGRFVPLIDVSQWEPVSPDVSEEELERREQSTEWCSMEEVIAHLESLENQQDSGFGGADFGNEDIGTMNREKYALTARRWTASQLRELPPRGPGGHLGGCRNSGGRGIPYQPRIDGL